MKHQVPVPWSARCTRLAIIRAVFFLLNLCIVSSTVPLRVLEESQPGTVVGNLSWYTPSFRHYKLEKQTAYWNYFAYSKETGIINTTQVIDRDDLSGVCSTGTELGVLLFSSSKCCERQIGIKVIIGDINDNSPQFSASKVSTKIPEEIDINQSVGIPIAPAEDRDCGPNGTVLQYSITKGNETGSFNLHLSSNRKSLSLVLLKKLDRETTEFYILNISACDSGRPAMCTSLLVNVTVLDYNDNKPLFLSVPSRVQVKEKCKSGKFVLTLNVTDKDSGKNAEFHLSVTGISPSDQLFKVNDLSHELITTQCLAYKKENPSYTVVIQAEDHGNPVQRSEVTIQVDVVDINDHSPVLMPVLLKVFENKENKTAGYINVKDDDDGQNANVSLKIISGNQGNKFYLDYVTLHYCGKLDREDVAEYNITIQACDHGSPRRCTTHNIIIPVIDVNDNYPVCQIPKGEIFISEAAPVGSYVTAVQAVDKDEGKNGLVKYSLADTASNQLFQIVESSGLLLTNGPLDYETNSSVEVRIIVEDNGDISLSSSCLLIVNITDVNDNRPLFASTSFKVALPEDIAAGSVILNLTALDADTGVNSRLSYNMLFPTPLVKQTFQLNVTTGTLQTLHPLDREIYDSFCLVVLVQDHGTPSLSSTAEINITVLDINDNRPIIYPRNYYSNILVNQTDLFIANITAKDPDNGKNGSVFYEIIEGPPIFHIDNISGKVISSMQIVSERNYTLKVVAKDGQGHASNTSILQISSITTQDDLPHFETDIYLFNVEENVQIGTYVGCVKATKNSNNGSISYVLYNGDPNSIFSLNENGEIRTSKQVDSEEQRQFILNVLAKVSSGERILIGCTKVVIAVEDVNDNPPEFQYPLQIITVNDTAPVGTLVYKVMAFDPDLGVGGNVKYESYDSDEAFAVEINSGNIIVAKDLTQLTSYTPVVTILASDHGLPMLSSILNLTLNVIKVNTHPPLFQSNFLVVPVVRDVLLNQPFFNLTVSDPNGGINSKVYFHLAQLGIASNYFGIFPEGLLFVKQSLQLTSQSTFLLKVIATDQGYPVLSASAVVNITVVDTIRHQLFKRDNYLFEVYENEEPGKVVGKLDLGRDTASKCENPAVVLMPEHPDFSFDFATYEILTKNVLDREFLDKTTGGSSYNFYAKVSCKKEVETVTDIAEIVICVKDKNDNKPVFLQSKYSLRIREDTKKGTNITKLATSDKDEAENSRINFTIIETGVSGAFLVDGEGNIILNSLVENGSLCHFNFTVQVQNIAPPYFYSTCFVEIIVNDVNNNSPVFTKPLNVVNVNESFPVGSTVFQAVAHDNDFGRNSQLAYSIVEGNKEGTFSIHLESGKVTLVRKLDFEDKKNYTLTICAVDSGVLPLSTKHKVIVNITDVNDNPPRFVKCVSNISVWENITVGSKIAECVAADMDSSVNGMISYSILRERPIGNYFRIDPNNGSLFVNKKLDREQFLDHQIEIKAEDKAIQESSHLSSTTWITVSLMDINDNPPLFTSPPAVAFNLSAKQGDYLITLTAHDPDAAAVNGRVEFFKGSNEDASLFKLDSTGHIVFAGNASGRIIYKLNVIASDGGTPPRQTTQKLSFFLAGGIGLSFVQNSYSVNIAENEPVGTFVVKVSADAKSSKDLIQIKYFITHDSSKGLFVLNSTTGVVSTNTLVDREGHQGNEVNLVIYAVNVVGLHPNTTSVHVIITILDKNDNVPWFLVRDYVKELSEDTKNGTNILTLRAHDDDEGRNGSVMFDIVGGNDEHFFIINKTSGQVSLVRVLDYELRSSYALNVTASDDGQPQLMSWNIVVINVLDVNDNYPVFKRSSYSFTVIENSPVGTALGETVATDHDSGDNGKIVYTLSGEDCNLFSVNARSGLLRTASVFDREKIAIYLIKVVATDEGKPVALSTSVYVYISILDENDNDPSFEGDQPYKAKVQENLVTERPFLTLHARDKDFGLNSKLVYYISGGNDDKAFGISSNGTLFTASVLDRETKARYSLKVTVSDCAPVFSKRRSSTTDVVVTVIDMNDETPYFETTDVVHVREDQQLGVPFTTVVAIDKDTGLNGQIVYELQGVVANSYFQIDSSSGALSLKKTLDRDSLNSGHVNITVEAKDRGQPANLKRRDMKIIVDDVNDNTPVFYPHISQKKVYENISIGSEILRVTAVDIDQGRNGMVEYEIVTGNTNRTFSIHPVDGIITVIKPLDREAIKIYELNIAGFDLGKPRRENTTLFRVQVLDINDNPPRFLSRPVIKHIKENVPYLQNFAFFPAVDDDEGKNGQIMYSIVHAYKTPFLDMNTSTGAVSLVSSLDRESQSQYSVIVQIKDKGIPSLYAQTHLTVIVQDKNDNSPVFVNPDLRTSIPENSRIGSRLCVMNATDADYGKNAKISYALVNDFSRFRINSETGEIVTTAELDRELHGSHFRLVVRARDSGNPSREILGNVIGRITDIDDNKAKFTSKKYSVYTPAKAPSHTFITAVLATDEDEGINGKVVYAIKGDSSDFFVESDSGNILSKTIMPSSSVKFTLQIQALNANTLVEEDITSVDITVSTQTFPVFDIPVTVFNISENSKPGHFILHARATFDPVFHIASGDVERQFSIDVVSGNLTLNNKLDYEIKRNYSLWLKASLSTQYSTYININVFVVDVNDNKPIFKESFYEGFVMESDQTNVTVIRVIAEDYDSGLFGLVEYSIVETTARAWFRIERFTGYIYTIRGIDREQNNTSFDFTVQARDQGFPQNSNNVSVHVNIVDVNDNAPVFLEIPPVYIFEDVLPPLLVTTVFAEDKDEDSRLLYSLAPDGNFNQAFSIQPLTGAVFLCKKLDREIVANYFLNVTVTDGRFSRNAVLDIVIKDVDDNPPKFLKPRYAVKMLELMPVESEVINVNVSDEDIGPNADVVYSLKRTPTSDIFRIGSKGIITLATQLRYVKSSIASFANPNEYNVTVLAENPTHPFNKAKTVVTIEIIDANDHSPVFEKNKYFTYVPSASKKGTRILSVKATDTYDVGRNSEVLYKAINGNGTDLFQVGSNTGHITVKGDLTSFTDSVFLVEVEAVDCGKPVQTSKVNAKVFVTITVENRYPPVFSQQNYAIDVEENRPVGSELLRVNASDRDDGINGRVAYSILPGKQEKYFSIGSSNGSVAIANVKLDYEYITKYVFEVLAKDGARHPKNATATVEVNVIDYNDNPPVFQPSFYQANVFENSPIDSTIVTVLATDRDTIGNSVSYFLTGEDKGFFSIIKQSGVIRTKIAFDYELRTNYKLTVLARDSGNPQKTSGCTVDVKVIGENEFSPKFSEKQYSFSTQEDSKIGYVIGRVSATDGDKGPDGIVQYFLVNPSGPKKNFDINQYTGEIFVSDHLDSETTNQVQFSVLVKNPTEITVNADNTDKAVVTIEIRDSNDPPRFLRKLVKTSVDENIQIGSVVGNLSAVDDDVKSDFASPFKFSILFGNFNDSFLLVTVKAFAIVKTAKNLDREEMATFNLTIAATDIMDPTLVGIATLIVEVRDVNDNAPSLMPGICPGHVKENQPKGTIIVRLDALDHDIDPNKDPYNFEIVNKARVPFSIDRSTWELKTNSLLDREKVLSYLLLIKVEDSGYPKQSSVATCMIIVDDVNDNLPSAETRKVTVNIPGSGFLSGVIGDVSPVDADLINTYKCTVEGRYNEIFSFLPGSCTLKVKKPQLTFYILNVRADDKVHQVSYSLNITFNKISDITSERSVLLRLSGISPEQFLSVMDAFPCKPGYVKQILSIQNVNSSVIDVFLAHLKNGVYISKTELSLILKQCKNNLEKFLGATIIDTNYNLCSSMNPCIHGDCQSRVVLLPRNRSSLYSKTQVFVSASRKLMVDCNCYSGFSGNNCEHSTKVCLSAPCKNAGRCTPTDSGFICQCPPNYTGKLCESPLNLCNPNPCSNTSTCISSSEGPTCQCDFGGRGKYCEFTSVGFKPTSYVKFPTLPSSNGKKFNNISLQFATVDRNALILFNRDYKDGDNANFIALEVISGLLRFSFNLGGGVVRIVGTNPVSDGQWHTVTATRDKTDGHLSVDGKAFYSKDENPSNEILELNNSPLYFGGVASLDIIFAIPDQVSSYDFVGCMREIYFNGAVVNINMASVKSGVIPSCPRVPGKTCHEQSCHGSSTCVDKWFSSICQCTNENYVGEKCDKNAEPLTLTSGSTLQFQFDPSYVRASEFSQRKITSRRPRAIETVQTLFMKVRSRNDYAFLWRAEDTLGNYTQLQITAGFIRLSFGNDINKYQHEAVSGIYVNNGYWCNITLIRDRSSNSLTLSVNGSRNQTYPKEPYVFLGGTWTFGTPEKATGLGRGFHGCLSSLKINEEVLSLNVSNQYGILQLLKGQISSGCESPNFCASNPCHGKDSKCVNTWKSYICNGGALETSDSLSVGAIAAIVFFCILVVAIVVAVIAIKKRRTSNELASNLSRKKNGSVEQDNSRGSSSSSESIPSCKTLSRHSLDSGVDIHNANASLSPGNSAKARAGSVNVNTSVIPLGSPDEYTIVTSRRDSGSDQRDTGFTDSECEYGITNRAANLTISSIPSNVNAVPTRKTQPRYERSPFYFKKKVPYLINRGYRKDTRIPSRSTSPTDEPESIEMQNRSIDIDNAEQYSIGNSSLATYSDLNYSNIPTRSSDTDRMHYKPSLERFPESEDSGDEQRLSNLANTFEPLNHVASSAESSDGGFTVSECDYDGQPDDEFEEDMPTADRPYMSKENLELPRSRQDTLPDLSMSEYDKESSVDGLCEAMPETLEDVMNWGMKYSNLRNTCKAISQLRDSDEDVEIV